MVGCLQAIRHGTSPVTRRRDWISGQGDLSCQAGEWGLSNTSARWCDKSSHDCFQSFLNLHKLNIFFKKIESICQFSTCVCGMCTCVCVCDRLAFICSMCIFMWACLFLCVSVYIITCVHASKLCVWARESYAWPSAPVVIPLELSHWAPVLLHYIPLILKLHMKPDNKPQSLIYLPKRPALGSCCR